MTSLNIVAHPDDDLLFLNSDIAEEFDVPDTLSTTVYLTAGDDGNDDRYIHMRMAAVHNAYREMGVLGERWTPKYFWFKSSCFRLGNIHGDLYRMWHGDSVSNLNAVFYSRETVIAQLQSFIDYIKPDIIRTHNPNVEPALTHDEPHLDHVDHIYTAKFVQEAAKQFPPIPVYAYMGYPIRYQPPNLTEHQTMLKTTMWRAYQSVDTSVSGNIWDVALDKCYKERIQ